MARRDWNAGPPRPPVLRHGPLDRPGDGRGGPATARRRRATPAELHLLARPGPHVRTERARQRPHHRPLIGVFANNVSSHYNIGLAVDRRAGLAGLAGLRAPGLGQEGLGAAALMVSPSPPPTVARCPSSRPQPIAEPGQYQRMIWRRTSGTVLMAEPPRFLGGVSGPTSSVARQHSYRRRAGPTARGWSARLSGWRPCTRRSSPACPPTAWPGARHS